MAVIVSKYTNEAGQEIAVYESGAEYNTVEKRLVKPAAHTVLTAERATSLNRQQLEKKRQRARDGANAALLALQRRDKDSGGMVAVWESPRDLDFVEAITEAQTAQALSVDSPYSTMAANFVMKVTGMDEKPEADPPTAADMAKQITMAAELYRLLKEAVEPREIIEGKVNE